MPVGSNRINRILRNYISANYGPRNYISMTTSPRGRSTNEDARPGRPNDRAARPVNRLATEDSPYLRQHAHNPVDWFPWSEEALQRARQQGKPIFLSIGYSACHWCHVMERESFEDPETARILNEHFVAIKVDREERPDLDEIFMTAVQMMTGQGGWPLSVFLTPAGRPFFGGTYFPPKDAHGLPAFKRVLKAVSEAWRLQRGQAEQVGEQIARALRLTLTTASDGGDAVGEDMLDLGADQLKRQFDPKWGGFGGPPKFPMPGAISFLLRQHQRSGDRQLLDMATLTLERMAYGGIHDQIGGGFHRYATDARWLVPHFEKMLYDNAQLASVYLEAWQATGKEVFRQVARGTLEYVLREMRDPGGGFHSSQDADTEGEEGKFYLWKIEEIFDILGSEEGEFFCEYYGVSEEGNFQGANILYVPDELGVFARRRGISEQHVQQRLAVLRQKLLAARSRRVPPAKDDKVLSAWNGLMISALARGYQVCDQHSYLEAAERAANFVLTRMVRDGALLHTYRGSGQGEGSSKLPGYLDDYAEISAALLDLYEAGFDPRWLQHAERLAQRMLAEFWDAQGGGLFYTSAAHDTPLVRSKTFHDGSVPSGNATAAMVLLRLSKLLDKREYLLKAERLLEAAAEQVRRQPMAYLSLLCAVDFYLRPTKQIVVAGRRHQADTRKLLQVICSRFIPNKIVVLAEPEVDPHPQYPAIPLAVGKPMISAKATAYLCQGFTCAQPVTEAAELEKLLDSSDGGRSVGK